MTIRHNSLLGRILAIVQVSSTMFTATLGFSGCFLDGDKVSDGGVDVPNSLQARLLSTGTCRAEGAQVRIRPADWTPLSDTTSPTWNTTSSSDGSITMPLKDTGDWVLEARDSTGGCGVIRSFDIDSSKGQRTIQLGDLSLERFGSIEGSIATAGSGTDSVAKWSIVIPGVDVVVTPDSNGIWRIELLSAGSYAPIAVFKGVPEQVAIGKVEVAPQTTSVAPPTVVEIPDGSIDRIVRGKATTSTGSPTSGGSIRLVGIDGTSQPERNFAIDDSGRYAFALPDSGRWLLRIASGSDVFVDTLEPADLTDGLPATRTRLSGIRLQASSTLAGAILMPLGIGTGPGLASDWKMAIQGAGIQSTSAVDGSGQYLFTGLATGTYALSASNAKTSLDTSLGSFSVAAGTATRLPATTITSGMADPGLKWIEGKATSSGRAATRARIVALPESVGIVAASSQRQRVLVETYGITGSADDSGRFSLQLPETGPYRLVVTDSSGKMGKSIPWGLGADTTKAADLRLEPLGSARLGLELPSGTPTFHRYSGFTWSVLGTTRRISTSSSDFGARLGIDSLATGEYRSVLIDVNTGSSLPFEFRLRVPPGGTFDTTVALRPAHLEDSTQWSSQVKLEVVPPQDVVDVANFPLRLRLDSIVDFASSSADGHDLRILDAKGNWLPVWLSRWEPATHRAEAWVLLDTLHAGHPTALTVRSGNPTAATLSTFASDSVFRSQDGWIGAWSGSDGRSLMGGTQPFELSSVLADTGFSSGGMKFDSFSRAVAEIPDGAIAQGYTLLVNLATHRNTIDPQSYFSIQSNSGHQTHALWGLGELGDTARPLVMCKDVVDNEFFANPDLPVVLLPEHWTQFVLSGSGDSSIVARAFVDGAVDAQVTARPAPPLSGPSEIVLEAANWDPASTWIRRKN